MSALSLRMSEASKNRHFLYDGFPKPHHDQDRTHRSLLFGSSPSTRASSPYPSTKASPMPSPMVLPPRDLTTSTTTPQTTPSTPPTTSKTNAFFGSAWAARIPTPAPPPVPLQRSNSLHPTASAAHSRSSTKYGNLGSEASRDFAPRSCAVSDSYAPSRTQTADFFNRSKPSTPTPPPSILSITPSPKRAPGSLPTPSPSPAKLSTTPPEFNSARLNVPSFFPGRVSGDTKGRSTDDDIYLGFPDTLNNPLSRLPSLHRPTTGLAIHHPSTSHVEFSIDNGVDGSGLSRSSSRSSVSGFRRDFYIGSPGSALSGYQAPKPGPYERESDRDGTPWVNLKANAEPIETRMNEDTALTMSPTRAEFHAGENEDFQDNQQPAGITAHPSPPSTMKLAQHHFAHSGITSPVRRETRRSPIEAAPLEPGTTIGDEVPFELVKPLGQGAFSSVWLARDVEDRLLPPLARSASKKQRQKRRKSASMAKRLEEYVRGIKPSVRVNGLEGSGPGVLDEMDGKGACWPDSPEASRSNSTTSKEAMYKPGRLVAVKMMDRSLCDTNDRTRISFVREVEVLRVSYCVQFPFVSYTDSDCLAHLSPFHRLVLAFVYNAHPPLFGAGTSRWR